MPPWSRMCVSARVSRSRVVSPGGPRRRAARGCARRADRRCACGELLGRLALAAVTVEQTHAAEPYRRPAPPPHPAHLCPVESREHAVPDAVPAACSLLSTGPGGSVMRSVDGSRPSACAKPVRVARRLGPRRRSSAHSSLTRHPRSSRSSRTKASSLRRRRSAWCSPWYSPTSRCLAPHEVALRQPLPRGIRHGRVHLGLGEPASTNISRARLSMGERTRVAPASARGAARPHRVAGSSSSASRAARDAHGPAGPSVEERHGGVPRDDEVGEVSWPRRSSPRSHQVSATSTTRSPVPPGSRPPAPRARGARRPLGGAPSRPGWPR